MDKFVNSIEVTADGKLFVRADLTAENGHVMALGILEEAKQIASSWIAKRRIIMRQAMTSAAVQEKTMLDQIIRRDGKGG